MRGHYERVHKAINIGGKIHIKCPKCKNWLGSAEDLDARKAMGHRDNIPEGIYGALVKDQVPPFSQAPAATLATSASPSAC